MVANSTLVQVDHPMLKIFPETLDPQQLLYCGLRDRKLDHKFSLGLGPNHLVLEVLPQCDARYGYVRPIARLLGA